MPRQPDPDHLLEAAFAAHEAHRPDDVWRFCRQILNARPDHAEALNLAGVTLQNAGRAAESIPLLSRATELDPEFSDAFANLARGFRLMGNEEQAVTAAREATELDRDSGEAWLHLGLALATLGRHDEALPALRQAAVLTPGSVELHTAIGCTARALNNHQVAADAWAETLRLQPNRVDAMVNLGWALTEMNRPAEAETLLRAAVERAPEDVVALEALAKLLHRRFEGAELISVCRRILAIQPERLDIWALLSNGQLWLGQFDEIERTRASVLAVDPENRSFARQIAAVLPNFMDRDEILLCRAQLVDASVPVSDRIHAGFALAKALERDSEYDAAFEAYRAANALVHAEINAVHEGFNPRELRSYVATMRAQYTPATFTALQSAGNCSEMPVFVVGMPRSGTSMVEQIAASHPRVFGAGERRDEMLAMIKRLDRDRGFVSPTQWDPDQSRRETGDHLARLLALAPGVERVIDKLPDNIQFLGQIRVLFPNARIIVCRRDLRDVCVSCFTTNFGDPIAWSNDLEECAERAVEIERLTRHWRVVIPGPILEISYETLVGNLESESRRLMEFLGLDWDPACLEFHKTRRVVATSSAWQVRQPLYDSSVGRWRRYRKHLGPLLKVLAGYVPDDD